MTGVRPVDALDAHVGMVRAFRNPPAARSIGEAAFQGQDVGGTSLRRIADAIDRGATLVVTDRMLDRVLERMDSIEFGEPLLQRDMELMPAAYVVLPRPVVLPDLTSDDYEEVFPSRAFVGFDAGLWAPSYTGRIEDVVSIEPSHEPGPGLLYGQFLSLDLCASLLRENAIDADERARFEAGITFQRQWGLKHAPVYFSGWRYDLTWDPALREEGFVLSKAGEFERRFWLSLWRTLGEEIIAPVHLPRPVMRRAARFRADVPEVVVCDLRRVRHREKVEPTADGAAVLWSHRWRVRAHLRTLHRGTPEERVVPVRECVKGPAGMPLLEKDRVFRLRR